LSGTAGLLLALSSFLAACGDKCEGVHCAPCNGYIEEVALRFDLDSLRGGFRKAEINGGYAVRYRPPGFISPIDTVRQQRNGNNFYGLEIYLRSLAPYEPSNPNSYTNYNYRLVLPAANRTYDISGIEVKSERGGDGCCNCGGNTRRRFALNGVPVVSDGESTPTTFLNR
jgi:hypothetical protein